MPDLNAVIQNFVVGDDIDITRTITAIPAGDTVAKAWFTVKRQEDDSDARVVFQRVISSVLTSSGIISDTGGSGTAVLTFHLLAADTVLMTGGRGYVFDIQLKTMLGKIYTPEKGTITGKKQITLATT